MICHLIGLRRSSGGWGICISNKHRGSTWHCRRKICRSTLTGNLTLSHTGSLKVCHISDNGLTQCYIITVYIITFATYMYCYFNGRFLCRVNNFFNVVQHDVSCTCLICDVLMDFCHCVQ